MLVHHRVNRVFEFEDLAFHVNGDLAREVAASDGSRDFGDVADLASEVAGHEVNVVGQIFPGSGNAPDLRLTAELTFGTDFTGHARDFASEGVELVNHRINGVLQFQNFTFDIHRDFAGEVAAGHRGGDFRDIADLSGEVPSHGV